MKNDILEKCREQPWGQVLKNNILEKCRGRIRPVAALWNISRGIFTIGCRAAWEMAKRAAGFVDGRIGEDSSVLQAIFMESNHQAAEVIMLLELDCPPSIILLFSVAPLFFSKGNSIIEATESKKIILSAMRL